MLGRTGMSLESTSSQTPHLLHNTQADKEQEPKRPVLARTGAGEDAQRMQRIL